MRSEIKNENTALEILIEGRALIADPSHWTKGDYAIDIDRYSVDLASDKAVCFCSVGALWRASYKLGNVGNHSATSLLTLAVQNLTKDGSEGIVSFNDAPDRKHEDVLKAFDLAIELAKS